jgi:hypothetical protein
MNRRRSLQQSERLHGKAERFRTVRRLSRVELFSFDAARLWVADTFCARLRNIEALENLRPRSSSMTK